MNNTTNTNKDRFCTARLYRNPDGKFYGVIEGNLTRDVTLSDGPKAKYVMNGLASGKNDFARMGRYIGMQIPDDVEIKTFVNLQVFGKKAELFAKHTKKGAHVIVAGPVSYNEEFKNLNLIVDEFVAHPGFDDQFISGGVARFTNVYTTRAGDERQEPAVAMMTGKVCWVQDLNENGKTPMKRITIEAENNPELTYELACGSYNKEKKYDQAGGKFSVTTFGRTAERLNKIARNGMTVAITGRITKDSNEESGKVYYNIMADDFMVIKWPPKDKEDNAAEASSEPKRNKASQPVPDVPAPSPESDFAQIDDEDMDVPF